MNTAQALAHALDSIAQQKHWPTPAEWTRYHLSELSHAIADKTGITISIDTLRRLAGQKDKSPDYDPQQATKEALAKFLDYNTWEDFKKSVQAPAEPVISESSSPTPTATKHKSTNYKLLVRDALFLCLIAVCAWWVINYFYEKPRKVLLNFVVSKNHGYAPQTVSVAYERNSDYNDSLHITWPGSQWKESEKVRLRTLKDTLYYTFQIPDVYEISISNAFKKMDSARVVIPSNGWSSFAYVKNNLYMPLIPKLTESVIQIDTAMLAQYFYPLDNVFTDIRYIKPDTITAEKLDMSFKVLQYLADKPYFCRTFSVKVPFEKGNIELLFNSKGCRANTFIQIGNQLMEGKWHNLEGFEQDFSTLKPIRIINDNGNFSLWVNKEKVFEHKHQQALGNLQGVIFCFQGAGEIRELMWGAVSKDLAN